MRIGVRVAEPRVTAVYVTDDGEYGTLSLELGGSDPEEIAAVFEELMDRLERDPNARISLSSVGSVTFELSAILEFAAGANMTAVRIAPRPPIDAVHELRGGGGPHEPVRVAHVAGGHSSVGEELVPLDAEQIRALTTATPPGGRYVVTGVGSMVNEAHEVEVGRALLEQAAPTSVGYSRSFYSSSFATRERTALANGALLAAAEAIATPVALVAKRRLPQARLYLMTNDGGCAPFTRLSVFPIHSAYTLRVSQLVGAAAIRGMRNGRLMVAADRRPFLGEMLEGVPTVGPQFRDPNGVAFATKAANLVSPPDPPDGTEAAYPVVATAGEEPDWCVAGSSSCIGVDVDLAALGAACAPLGDWVNWVVKITTQEDFHRALASAEARVRARLVSFGAVPSQVRIVESRAEATRYDHPNVVAVRVRGVAGAADAPALVVRGSRVSEP